MTGCLLAVLLVFMVITVSRATAKCYIVSSDGWVEIQNGRFSRRVRICIDDIQRIDKIRGGALVIVLKDQTEHFITPRNETDFIRCIEKYHS